MHYLLGVRVYFSLLGFAVFGFHLLLLDVMTYRWFVLVVEQERAICKHIVYDGMRLLMKF